MKLILKMYFNKHIKCIEASGTKEIWGDQTLNHRNFFAQNNLKMNNKISFYSEL